MTDKNDGGLAFPALIPHNSQFHYPANGMTLRDWFAGQALASIGTWMPTVDLSARLVDASVLAMRAEWAYRQADAMLAARNK